jgi:3-oxoacid CoA-transferase A subunit
MLTIDPARVRKVIVSFPTSQSRTRGFGSVFTEAIEQGKVDLELVPQGTLAERLRAGGAGIPAFFTPTGAGTRFADGKEVREFEGREYVMERWLRADYAFVHAIKADRLGNLVYRNTARNFNPLMASAARCTIAEVDELVEPGEISPYEVVTPGIFVHRIVALGKK